jgi:hypothetical protein
MEASSIYSQLQPPAWFERGFVGLHVWSLVDGRVKWRKQVLFIGEAAVLGGLASGMEDLLTLVAACRKRQASLDEEWLCACSNWKKSVVNLSKSWQFEFCQY